MMLACWFVLGGACGPTGTYSRKPIDGSGGGTGQGATGGGNGSGGIVGGGTGGVATGAGGLSGGASGGTSGNAGNAGTAGLGDGGAGGGAGGSIGSGGLGTAATGGRATGGNTASGGMGAGGTNTGGTNTGGSNTGGSNTGGAIGAGGASSPRILSIDFVGGRAAGGAGGTISIPMGPDESAGVKPATHWNRATGPSGSLSTLLFSDGSSATGTTATWDAPLGGSPPGIYGLGYVDAPGDVRMMNGCLNPAWSAAPASPVPVLTVSGLPANFTANGYDVYVYVLGGVPNETRAYTYAIGATTIAVTQVGPTPAASIPYTYTLVSNGGAGNYIVFRNVTTGMFQLSVKSGTQSSNQFRSPVNGIQIVSPSGS